MVSVITKVVAWIDFRIRSKESINNSFKKIVNNLESNSNLNELPKKIQKLANYILTDRYKKLEIEDRDIKQIIALLSPQVIKEDPLVKKIVETLKIKLGRVEQSENNVPPPPTKPTNQSQNNPVSNQNNLQKPPPFPGNQPKKGSEGAPPPPPITGQQKNKIPAEQPKAKGEPKFFSSFKELNDEIKKNEADLDKFKNEHNDNFFNFKNFVQLNESLLAKFDEASKKVATNQAQQPKCENINNKIVLAIESLEIGQQTNQPVKLSFLDKNSKLNKTIIFYPLGYPDSEGCHQISEILSRLNTELENNKKILIDLKENFEELVKAKDELQSQITALEIGSVDKAKVYFRNKTEIVNRYERMRKQKKPIKKPTDSKNKDKTEVTKPTRTGYGFDPFCQPFYPDVSNLK